MDLKGNILNGLNLSGTLSSPANLRMMSPAKSARRSGAWKFWDDASSRRGSSPSLSGSLRSRGGKKLIYYIVCL